VEVRRNRGRGLNVRLLSVGTLLGRAWVGVGYRLVVVQGLEAEAYSARGLDQRLQREVLAADRGTIFDRDGRELAVTVDSVTVYANPQEIESPTVVARLLAPLIDRDMLDVLEALSGDATFAYVARQLEEEDAELVRRARLPGIYFLTEPKRVYPMADLTAQVIGFVRTHDNHGLEGLELQYDGELSGTPGELLVERDPYGRTIPQGEYRVVPAEPGSDLVLTIKTEIQFAAERALGSALERTGAAGGSIVVLEPATGEVLAMVNLPTFDPNDRDGSGPDGIRNRAVTDTFEPGSTQKLVTIAGALEDGLVDPGTGGPRHPLRHPERDRARRHDVPRPDPAPGGPDGDRDRREQLQSGHDHGVGPPGRRGSPSPSLLLRTGTPYRHRLPR
jgi:cell division protein FtsI/penicillin-binding protein 2